MGPTSPMLLLVTIALLGIHPSYATNYLVVIADDLGVDKVGAWQADFPGYAEAAHWMPATPTLDALAGSGLRFTRAWAEPVCSPTRVSIQTGEHPFRSNVGRPLADGRVGPDWGEHTMLADVLHDRGYATALFGKWHLGADGSAGTVDWTAADDFPGEVPNAVVAGYDTFDGFMDAAVYSYTDWRRVRHAEGFRHTRAWDETGYATTVQAAATLDWIDAQTRPWFAVLAFSAPHVSESGPLTYGDVDPACVQSPYLLDCLDGTTECDEVRATYAGLVECMDTSLGDLLAGMDPAVLDDTLIVFVGDNGAPHWVSEWRFADPEQDGVDNATGRGKDSVTESGINVPLLVTDGRNYRGDPTEGLVTAPGRTVTRPVSAMGIYNTVIRSATGSSVAGVDSDGFNECFRSTDANCGRLSTRPLYAEAWYPDVYAPPHGATAFTAALRLGDLVVTVVPGVTGAGELCRDAEVYDTSTDYWEITPLTDAGLVARFQGLVDGVGADWMLGLPWC